MASPWSKGVISLPHKELRPQAVFSTNLGAAPGSGQLFEYDLGLEIRLERSSFCHCR